MHVTFKMFYIVKFLSKRLYLGIKQFPQSYVKTSNVFFPGSIIFVWPYPVPAREHDSASFPGTHIRHSATREVSGAEA